MHYCVSDIHGNADALNKILEKINFSDTDDELYVLGDVCDRHPYGVHILLEFMKHKNVHLIRGNHEEFILKFYQYKNSNNRNSGNIIIEDYAEGLKNLYRKWAWNGGNHTIADLIKLGEQNPELENHLIDYINKSPYSIDLNLNNKKFILRHNLGTKEYQVAKCLTHNVDDVYTSIEEFMVWDRNMLFTLDYPSDTVLVFGHTPVIALYDSIKNSPALYDKISFELFDKLKEVSIQKRLNIFNYYNQYCIDCGAAYSNNRPEDGMRLACLRLEDMAEFYSND